MKILIYIVWPVRFWEPPAAHVARLRDRFPDIEFVHAKSDGEALAEIKDADAAFAAKLSPEMVRKASRLRWVHSSAVGVATLPLAELAAKEVLVTNSRGIQDVPIAEQILAGLLVLARRLDRTLAAQRDRRWTQNEMLEGSWPWTLRGKSLTILGLGGIGTEVARRAHAFGMRVTGVRRRTAEPLPAFVDQVLSIERLAESLHGCDVLVITAPFVSGTNRLITGERLDLLNPGAVVANVSRGQILDESALVDRLRSGRLGGAVLDVFETEPLPPENPLWALPNVVITPHNSGYRADHWDDVIDLYTDNIRRFRNGEKLRNVVDCALGY